MKPSAYFINVARGAIVETNDLVSALNEDLIAGAGVDVTYPEPLPDAHPLWSAKNIIITPHTADTNEMVTRLFAVRVGINVKAFFDGDQLIGLVDPDLGY
jgi:phosphoglycerate dehydrogenase-like enzyme